MECREGVFPETQLPLFGFSETQLPILMVLGNSRAKKKGRGPFEGSGSFAFVYRRIACLFSHLSLWVHKKGAGKRVSSEGGEV